MKYFLQMMSIIIFVLVSQFTEFWIRQNETNPEKENNLCGLLSDKIIAVWYTSKINNSTND